MSTEQIFKEITGVPKWYIPHYKQPTASMIVKRFNSGTLSVEKTKEVFTKFGYELNITWQKNK